MLRIFMKLGKYVPEKPREGELMKHLWESQMHETWEIKAMKLMK